MDEEMKGTEPSSLAGQASTLPTIELYSRAKINLIQILNFN